MRWAICLKVSIVEHLVATWLIDVNDDVADLVHVDASRLAGRLCVLEISVAQRKGRGVGAGTRSFRRRL